MDKNQPNSAQAATMPIQKIALGNSRSVSDASVPQLDEVLAKLATFLRERGSAYQLAALGCFGSVARAEATSASDVDVVYRLLPSARMTLFDLVEMREELMALLGRPVDLIEMRPSMPQRLKERLEKEAAYA